MVLFFSLVAYILLVMAGVVNETNISFNKDKWTLLNKDPKYNLNYKPKRINTLALEAETVINFLPIHNQDHFWWLTAKKLNKLYIKHPNNRHNTKEYITLQKVKSKLSQSNATVTRAEKGQFVIILHHDNYVVKIDNFITSNNFQKTKVRPNKFT
jgi:hypothetical protein